MKYILIAEVDVTGLFGHVLGVAYTSYQLVKLRATVATTDYYEVLNVFAKGLKDFGVEELVVWD